jgi:hypothetical protein
MSDSNVRDTQLLATTEEPRTEHVKPLLVDPGRFTVREISNIGDELLRDWAYSEFSPQGFFLILITSLTIKAQEKQS